MTKAKLRVLKHAEYIYDTAPYLEMRTGELLFDELRHEIADVVRDTELDTFYDEMDFGEILDWLDRHIIYDNQGAMVRLRDGNRVLWEEDYAA